MTNVMAQASNVPVGMATLGFFRSPEMFAPATEENYKHNAIEQKEVKVKLPQLVNLKSK